MYDDRQQIREKLICPYCNRIQRAGAWEERNLRIRKPTSDEQRFVNAYVALETARKLITLARNFNDPAGELIFDYPEDAPTFHFCDDCKNICLIVVK